MRVDEMRDCGPDMGAVSRALPGNLLLAGGMLGLVMAVGLLFSPAPEHHSPQEPERIHAGFATPSALAEGPRGTLYVADTERGEVVCLYPDGDRVVLKPGLARPTALAVDGMGTVYVYSASEEAIHAILPDGATHLVAADLPQVLDMAATHYGNLLVASSDGSVQEIHLDDF